MTIAVRAGATDAGPRQGPAIERLLARARLTVAGAVLVALVIGGWLLARQLGARSLFLLVYLGVLTIVLAHLASRRRLALTATRSDISLRMREGQVATVTLALRAERRVTTVIVEDRLDPELGPTVSVPVSSLGRGEEIEHRYTFTPRRRGVYRVGPTTAVWNDPFGLTVHEQVLGDAVEVIVHPATEGVHDRVLSRMWEDPPIRPPSSKPWPTGFEFYGMRDYVRGDDLRRVVWSAVAKTGRMLVRESEQGITDRISIMLDTDREWHKPGDPSDTFEAAVRVAASLATRHLKDGFLVTLSTNDRRLGVGLRGPRARFTILDELAKVDMGKATLADIGPFLVSDARAGSHFIIVTPHLDKHMTTRLRMVIERGASVVIVKIVWDESDPQSLARAASLGCQVVQVPLEASIEAAFTHQVGGGIRR